MASSGFTISSGSAFFNSPRQEAGFCEKHGIEHAWEAGPTLTSNPPIITRSCVNCGKGQRLEPERWRDYD